jgi:hypothetical protein
MMSKHDLQYETVTPDGQKIIIVDGPSEIASWVFPHEPEKRMAGSRNRQAYRQEDCGGGRGQVAPPRLSMLEEQETTVDVIE